MAFAVESYNYPRSLKNDPEFVRWHMRLQGEKDGEKFETFLPHHLCTEEDYAELYPIEPK